MHRGYIKIWRKTQDSGLLQLPNALALFIYMLLEATHKPIRYGTVDLERGQLVTGRHKLAAELEMSEQSVRTSLDHLIKLEFITSRPTNKYTIYTIVNYSKYQDVDSTPNQQINQPVTNEQPTSNQQVTTIQEHKHIRTKEVNVSIKKQPSEYSVEFLKFWDVWPASPRKGGRPDCFRIWKAKKLDAICETIITHVDNQKNSSSWKDPQYIPAPSVYLGQSRWDGAEIGVTQNSNDSFLRRIGAIPT